MVTVHDTYASQLYSLARGHAVYHPHPGWDDVHSKRNQAVGIGDVGYMFMGGFQRLFNIHLPHNHRNQAPELPEYFTPISGDYARNIYTTVSAPQGFCSHGIRAISTDIEATGSDLLYI
jgi:hypothetical protein